MHESGEQQGGDKVRERTEWLASEAARERAGQYQTMLQEYVGEGPADLRGEQLEAIMAREGEKAAERLKELRAQGKYNDERSVNNGFTATIFGRYIRDWVTSDLFRLQWGERAVVECLDDVYDVYRVTFPVGLFEYKEEGIRKSLYFYDKGTVGSNGRLDVEKSRLQWLDVSNVLKVEGNSGELWLSPTIALGDDGRIVRRT